MDRYFAEVEAGVFSWTWNVPAELLADAVEETKAWAAERFGDSTVSSSPGSPSVWRAYDLR
jgi:hypothetical protein